MKTPLLVVTGTGTGIGKTLVAEALVRAWAARGTRVVGLKPVESGVIPGAPSDVETLRTASTIDPRTMSPLYLFPTPVSPHRAARLAGMTIEVEAVLRWIGAYAVQSEAVVVELPGGLFSPLTDDLTNADLLRQIQPDRVVLVAQDRLGVLHDVIATMIATMSKGVVVDALVLSAPETPDASTGTNVDELARGLSRPDLPILALPRTNRAQAVERLAILLDSWWPT